MEETEETTELAETAQTAEAPEPSTEPGFVKQMIPSPETIKRRFKKKRPARKRAAAPARAEVAVADEAAPEGGNGDVVVFTGIVSVLNSILAMTKFDQLSEQEQKDLTESSVAVMRKYGLAAVEYMPELNLLFCVLGIVGSRYVMHRLAKAEAELERARQATTAAGREAEIARELDREQQEYAQEAAA